MKINKDNAIILHKYTGVDCSFFLNRKVFFPERNEKESEKRIERREIKEQREQGKSIRGNKRGERNNRFFYSGEEYLWTVQ